MTNYFRCLRRPVISQSATKLAVTSHRRRLPDDGGNWPEDTFESISYAFGREDGQIAYSQTMHGHTLGSYVSDDAREDRLFASNSQFTPPDTTQLDRVGRCELAVTDA